MKIPQEHESSRLEKTELVVDLETTGLNPHTDFIIGVGINNNFETNLEWAAHFLNGKEIIAHNGSFDLKFLWAAGIRVELGFDTMIAAYLLPDRPESLSLGSLAKHYLGISDDWKSSVNKEDMLSNSLEQIAEYCLKDVEITRQLKVVLEEKLIVNQLYTFFKSICKLRTELTRAEFGGMAVDWNRLNEILVNLKGEVSNINEKLSTEEKELIEKWQALQQQARLSKLKRPERASKKEFEFNWSSPKQVLWALKEIGANTQKWDFKERVFKDSSDSSILEQNKHLGRFIKPLLQLRQNEKTIGMLEGYLEKRNYKTGKLHGNFNITVTSTGRLSSSDPNLQNIDSGPTVRSLFIPSPGKTFVIADLAQIEVRMAAHYSKDPALLDMFKREEDFYGTIAVKVLKTPCKPNEVKTQYPQHRSVAKVIGLSILYGTGAKRLQAAIKNGSGVEYSEEACRKIIKDYFAEFKGLKELQRRVEEVILTKGYITNLFGRKLYIKPEDIYMNGVNYLLQSSASDLMLFRQLEFSNKSSLVALIHDECIRECTPEEAPLVKKEMERILQNVQDINFRIPLKATAIICNNWAEGKG